MEPVLEAHDALAAGERAGGLHGVLDRLGAAVQQQRALLVIAGRDRVEPLGQGDVRLVAGDGKADVEVPVELVAHGLEHGGVPVPHVDDADAAAEIDELVAVDVGQHRTFGVRDARSW